MKPSTSKQSRQRAIFTSLGHIGGVRRYCFNLITALKATGEYKSYPVIDRFLEQMTAYETHLRECMKNLPTENKEQNK